MPATIDIQVQSPRWKTLLRPYRKTVSAAVESALGDSKLARMRCRWEITVVLADDETVRELNRDYRGKDKPTNVLSFPSHDAFEKEARVLTKGCEEHHIGDIVLALETVEREAAAQDKPVNHHAMHLLVHATLHLLGHDHASAREASKMEAREIKILKKLGVRNPYL
jgi:probable rRNA maturation factor